jgi:hypothetical protein
VSTQLDDLKKLREPFAPNQIGKLPKGGVTLDFVGHAHVTARLLDVDPLWDWEPFAKDEHGLPQLDEHGGLWITLTVSGKTRIGYGDAGGKTGPNAIKEAIGDALRNAGMRFGIALELWTKGDLDAHPPERKQVTPADEARDVLLAACRAHHEEPRKVAARFRDEYGMDIDRADEPTVKAFHSMLSDEWAVDDAAAADG